MYAFTAFAMPTVFYILVMAVYPAAERASTRRAFLIGLAFSFPVVLVSRLTGSMIPDLYGSILNIVHEWADRFLPYTILPAAAYVLFYRTGEKPESGAVRRRLTAFYAGALSLTGAAEIFHSSQSPSTFVLFALPVLTISIMLAAPWFLVRYSILNAQYGKRESARAAERIFGKGVPLRESAIQVMALLRRPDIRALGFFLGAQILASALPGLFRHRLWSLAWPIVLGLGVLSWSVALPSLKDARD